MNETSLYEQLGPEMIRSLVDRFYDHMDTLPEVAGIRLMHAPSLKVSRDKLYWFLTGWTGGPQLYVERFGHPRLRARHLPFAIGPAESAQWLLCMKLALDEIVPDEDMRVVLFSALRRVAQHMENQAPV